MVAVILWGVADVIFTNVMSPPLFLLDVGDIFQIFGAFMVVLIAVEIFINIRLYLGTDELPLRLVIGYCVDGHRQESYRAGPGEGRRHLCIGYFQRSHITGSDLLATFKKTNRQRLAPYSNWVSGVMEKLSLT